MNDAISTIDAGPVEPGTIEAGPLEPAALDHARDAGQSLWTTRAARPPRAA